MPRTPGLEGYIKLAAGGWLDSKIGEGGLYRHAYPGAFNLHAAADATAMLDWLASRASDKALAARLSDAQKLAREKLAGEMSSSVGHIRTPAPALLYGDANAAAEQALARGRERLKQFNAD